MTMISCSCKGGQEVVESIKVIYPNCPIYPGSCNAKIPYDKTPPASLEYMHANQRCRGMRQLRKFEGLDT